MKDSTISSLGPRLFDEKHSVFNRKIQLLTDKLTKNTVSDIKKSIFKNSVPPKLKCFFQKNKHGLNGLENRDLGLIICPDESK